MIEEISPSKSFTPEGAPFENFKHCMGNVFFEDFHVKKQLHDLGILFEVFFKNNIERISPFECFHVTKYRFFEKCYSLLKWFASLFIFSPLLPCLLLFWSNRRGIRCYNTWTPPIYNKTRIGFPDLTLHQSRIRSTIKNYYPIIRNQRGNVASVGGFIRIGDVWMNYSRTSKIGYR